MIMIKFLALKGTVLVLSVISSNNKSIESNPIDYYNKNLFLRVT